MLSLSIREMAAAMRVLAKGDLARYGTAGAHETSFFERELARFVRADHALAVNSGTSALICALVGAGIGPGDEVMVPAFTWVSTAAAPLAVGAVPVLVDVDESLTIDPIDIKRKLTPQTKAIIPVHMINLVCDMNAIMQIASEHDLFVIEDACQAVGVKYQGRRVGSIGHAGAFSFNQHKNIKSGEGGALVTNDQRLWERARMYHDVGSYERGEEVGSGTPLIVGVNYRMPELSAAILRPQLRRLDKQLAKRREHRRIVLDELASGRFADFVVAPHHDPDTAVGLAVRFDDEEQARRFGEIRGVRRLLDSGRHVFTNWRSVIERNPIHHSLDPYRWAANDVDHSGAVCAQTLDVLARTCSVELAPELPTPLFRRVIAPMGR